MGEWPCKRVGLCVCVAVTLLVLVLVGCVRVRCASFRRLSSTGVGVITTSTTPARYLTFKDPAQAKRCSKI